MKHSTLKSSLDENERRIKERMSAMKDTVTKPVKLWRLDEHGRAQLTELHRDQFPGADEFRAAIDFHLERGCCERLADCYVDAPPSLA